MRGPGGLVLGALIGAFAIWRIDHPSPDAVASNLFLLVLALPPVLLGYDVARVAATLARLQKKSAPSARSNRSNWRPPLPDPLSRAFSIGIFRWDSTLPSASTAALAAIAQFGIVLAVVAVGLGAVWAARGSARNGLLDALYRLVPGVAAVLVALVAAHVVGLLLPEARPFVALRQVPLVPHAPDASFPSDHVSGGMAMLAARVGPRAKAVTFALVAIVGIARVLAGIHWLDDVVGAAILGLAVAWLVVATLSRVPRYWKATAAA